MGSPAVHAATSTDDALKMLDNHIPLTFREKELVVTGLYDHAFCEGARQGRQAGMESVQNIVRAMIENFDPANEMDNYVRTVLATLLPAEEQQEMQRQEMQRQDVLNLEAKQRALRQMTRPA